MKIRNSSRRSFMKLVAAVPLLSQIAARDLYAQAATAVGRDPRQNVYTRLGVKTVINCRGTWTYRSGSLEFPEVRQAQVDAAQHFVNILDLQRAVGRRLSVVQQAAPADRMADKDGHYPDLEQVSLIAVKKRSGK